MLKANPDAPQLPVRARALADSKLLYMAVPRLADPLPFYLLVPRNLPVPPEQAAAFLHDIEVDLAAKAKKP